MRLFFIKKYFHRIVHIYKTRDEAAYVFHCIDCNIEELFW